MGEPRILVVDALGGETGAALREHLRDVFGRIDIVDAGATPWGEVHAGRYAGIVLTGSHAGAYEPEPWIGAFAAWLRSLDRDDAPPLLGICFGHQLLAHAYGGRVEPRPPRRRGIEAIRRVGEDPLLDPLPERFRSVVAHGDQVVIVPDAFEVVACSDYCGVMAMRHRRRPIWGVQFHPDFTSDVLRHDSNPEWAAIPGEAIDRCEAPRVLERFRAMTGA